jgi:alkylhydroperoxidase/carboxymuconolactone decarboxylase family protein YurZ
MEHYLGVAKKNGVTDEEIGATQSVVMAVQAGRIRAQFAEARERGKTRE